MKQELQPHTRTIHRFLGEISAPWEYLEKFEVRFLREHKASHTAQFAMHAFDEMVEHIEAMNLSGMNCYVCVNPVPNDAPRNVKDEHIKRAYFAYVDADDLGAAERCREFEAFKPHMHVTTGTIPFIRCHTYYKFSQPLDHMDQWRQIQKNLIAQLGTDKAIHNASRIMRIAGTLSYPHKAKALKGYKTELTRLKIGGEYVQ